MSSPHDNGGDSGFDSNEDEDMNDVHDDHDSNHDNDNGDDQPAPNRNDGNGNNEPGPNHNNNNDDELDSDDSDDSSVSPEILRDAYDSDDGYMPGNYNALLRKYNRRKDRIQALQLEGLRWFNKYREKMRVIKRLQREIARLTKRRDPPVPWRVLLRQFLRDGDLDYIHVYRQSCKQENMSQRLDVFHPDFTLRDKKIPDGKLQRLLTAPQSRLPAVTWFQVDFLHCRDPAPFPFEKLPNEIQIRIFTLVFVQPTLIHCLSRLDPIHPPHDFPPDDIDNQTQLPNRFHFGTSPCPIILARKPNNILRPLLVCKRWFFIGVHAFYGANTFAFSSLGEWHRFCNGIGRARVERLVNVELMWHGALMPPHETRVSQRSLGLSWFTKTRRLRTLVVHIQEAHKSRMRRKYEMQNKADYYKNFADEEKFSDGDLDPFQMMIRRTDLHPNYRKFRSMRTVQGIDYIYQLRGMDWVRFKESNCSGRRQTIRDWSFLKDINTVVTTPKPESLEQKSHLRDLTPLTGLVGWVPSDGDLQIISKFYDETPLVGVVNGREASPSVMSIDSGYGSEGSDDVSTIGSDSDHSTDSSLDNDDDTQPRIPSGPGGSHSHSHRPNVPDIINLLDSDSDSDSDSVTSSSSDSDTDMDDSDGDEDGPTLYETQGTTLSPGRTQAVTIDLTHNDGNDRTHIDDGYSSSDGLFVSEGSCSGYGTTSGRVTMLIDLTRASMPIDLTDDADAESSLFVHSNSTAGGNSIAGDNRTVKTESSSDWVQHQMVDLTLSDSDEDKKNGEGKDDIKDNKEGGGSRQIKEESSQSPPGSHHSDRQSSTSSKRPRDDDSDSDGEGFAPKRPKGPPSPGGGSGDNASASNRAYNSFFSQSWSFY
ncbi:hypothetical protein F5B20DRAFT_591145 [Whalleya microplaca]|nr:hypothetical protein F5B20DRAFT_591145 [Whalleya microplaca]